jgi:hypothetical protein
MAQTSWSVENGRLWVSRDGGTKQLFLIKGVCYNPTPAGKGVLKNPLGRENDVATSAIFWPRDLPLLRSMGANAIRVYDMQNGDGTALILDQDPFFVEAWNGGNDPIYTLLSIWIPPETFGADNIDTLVNRYKTAALKHKDAPALLGFSVGAEFNAKFDNGDDNAVRAANPAKYWSNFKRLVDELRTALGTTKIITSGIIENYDFVRDAIQKDIQLDLWGVDLYKTATSFEAAWQSYDAAVTTAYTELKRPAEAPRPPLLVGEFGVPVSCRDGSVVKELPEGTGAKTMGAVTSYLSTAWSTIRNHGIGGFVFEWTDEWWKQDSGGCGGTLTSDSPGDGTQRCTPSAHDGAAALMENKYFPDGGGYLDEEWFGLNAIIPAASGLDQLRPRAAYDFLKNTLWKESQPTAGTTALDVPANSRIHINGFTNSATWEQKITVQVPGHDATSWTGSGYQANHCVGRRTIPALPQRQLLTISMEFSRGGNFEPLNIVWRNFMLPGLEGYVVGGEDPGHAGGTAAWNTVLFIYWARGY